LNFDAYRESITQIQRLAERFSSLTRADLAELNRLNEKCLSFNEEMVKSFSLLVDEIEDGLTLLLDRLDLIKKELVKISGPDGTLEDVLKLEPAWSQASALRYNIRAMLEPFGQEATAVQEPTQKPGGDAEQKAITQPAPAKPEKEIRELIGMAKKEAAAAIDKAPAVKTAPPVKLVKKENAAKELPPKKDHKPASGHNPPSASLPMNKNLGETEKKLMAEITKNMEAIKGNKKR